MQVFVEVLLSTGGGRGRDEAGGVGSYRPWVSSISAQRSGLVGCPAHVMQCESIKSGFQENFELEGTMRLSGVIVDGPAGALQQETYRGTA